MANKIKDLTNKKFGELVVIERDYNINYSHKTFWKCKCSCGNIKSISYSHLITGQTKSCGCKKLKFLENDRFGRWRVISRVEKSHPTKWLCQCDCGTIKEVSQTSLIQGKSISCGCYHKDKIKENQTTHNMTHSRLYRIYYNIKDRCYNNKNKRFYDYGGRNIVMCSEWKNNFITFMDWSFTNGYSDNLTIDRIDVNGNYEPNNCRWIHIQEQYNNKRNNVFIELFGYKKTIKEWTSLMGWKYIKYYTRHYRGNQVFNNDDLHKIEKKLKENNYEFKMQTIVSPLS